MITKSDNDIRLPAEWEAQSAVLLAWPHENTPWAPHLEEVRRNYLEIIRAILKFEPVILVTPDKIQSQLIRRSMTSKKLVLFEIPGNDTWARDFGPITVFRNGKPTLVDFTFNGWGHKYPAEKDNLISGNLHKLGAFGKIKLESADFVLEGGSIESDGCGTILATSKCLMNPNRNRGFSKKQIEEKMETLLGAKRILWLDHGHLEGDDTDSHIDTLARFAAENTIVHVSCDNTDDVHYKELKLMEKDLKSFRTANCRPYRLIPLPWPDAKYDDSGNRLPATYANFLIMNDAVLVPTYRDKKDSAALKAVSDAFPDRKIIGINCLTLIRQHGSLHCVTMQIPKGVIK
ncbi:MAG: agmatine deiminase family protein [Victivallales bacterium]|jgi:agmatine deiminase